MLLCTDAPRNLWTSNPLPSLCLLRAIRCLSVNKMESSFAEAADKMEEVSNAREKLSFHGYPKA